MSSFTQPLILNVTEGSDSFGRPLYEVTRSFKYDVGAKWSGLKISVPKGYVTNLGTVPTRILRRLFPGISQPYGGYIQATVLHDYLCNEEFAEYPLSKESGFSRWMADCIFREALEVLGYPRWKAMLVFAAVRGYAVLTRQV